MNQLYIEKVSLQPIFIYTFSFISVNVGSSDSQGKKKTPKRNTKKKSAVNKTKENQLSVVKFTSK